jgi:hypothetical protein
MTSAKPYLKLVLLVAVMMIVSLLGMTETSQATPTCQLDDCNDFCNNVCAPNGGVPWTCSWAQFQGICRGICYCF